MSDIEIGFVKIGLRELANLRAELDRLNEIIAEEPPDRWSFNI